MNKHRKRGLPYDVVSQIQTLRNQGYRVKEIQAMLGISASTVCTYSVSPYKLLKIGPRERDEMLIDMRKHKVPWQDIAKELCLSQSTLKKLYYKAKRKEEEEHVLQDVPEVRSSS